jgi:hypothetical protein
MEGLQGRLGAASQAVRDVLRNPDIGRLQAGWTMGIAADWILLVTILIVAYDAGGAAAVGLFGLVRMLPSTAVALLMPVPARLTRDRLIVAINAIRAGGAAVAAVALLLDAPVAVPFAAAAVVASAGALVRPSQTHLLPALARSPDELIASNVASSTGEGLGTLAGPVIGGLLVTIVGPAATAGLAAVAFVAAAVAVAGIRVHAAARQVAAAGRRKGLPVAEGFAAFAAQPAAGVLIGAFTAQLLVRGLLSTLIVVASIELLGLGEAGVGWLNAAVGAGGFLGALAALGLAGSRRLAPGVSVSLAAWGLPIALIGVLPVAPVALVGLAVVGVANATLDVAGFTLLQRTVPAAARPGVFAIIEGAAGVAVAAGAVLAPVLVDRFGIQAALAISGGILPVTAVAVWSWVARLDHAAVVPERELRLLRGVPMFALLPLDAIERLAASLTALRFAAGSTVMGEGEPGDLYVIVAEGSLRVTQGGRLLRTLGPGDGAGEIALLRHVPRTATVTATSDSVLYALRSGDFLEAVTGHPHSQAEAHRIVEERLAPAAGDPPPP